MSSITTDAYISIQSAIGGTAKQPVKSDEHYSSHQPAVAMTDAAAVAAANATESRQMYHHYQL